MARRFIAFDFIAGGIRTVSRLYSDCDREWLVMQVAAV